MAVRRTRPPQPLAPHGIPGHLVEFVEALRGQGISVGPSETVDAGRVMSVLGLGDREVLREGIACAVLRRPDHRDTYDAMFDLWFPAALGRQDGAARRRRGRRTTRGPAARGHRGDARGAGRLAGRQRRSGQPGRTDGRDDRADRRGVRPVQLQPRAVVLVVSGAQGDEPRRPRGPAAGRPAGALRRRADTDAGTDRQSSCSATHHTAAQDGRGGDQAPHRRTAGPRPRADVRRAAAGRERRVPARLR